MKKSFIFLCFFLGYVLLGKAQTIPMEVNILDSNGQLCNATLPIGGTGMIEVWVYNSGPGTAPAYKLKPAIAVPTELIKITGVHGLPDGWSICSQNDGTIMFTNGPSTLDASDGVVFYVDVKVVATVENSIGSTVGPNVFWGGGTSTTACDLGIPLLGDKTVNSGIRATVKIGPSLPVKLMQFTATKQDDATALLNWKTTEEVNTYAFDVERSINGKDFVKVGSVAAANSFGTHEYPFIDPKPLKGTNIYRLKMIDIDGSFTYSGKKAISFSSGRETIVFPNPVHDGFRVSETPIGSVVKVMDLSGRTVLQKKIVVADEVFNLSQFSSGPYVVQITDEKGIVLSNLKIIKE